jgi:hypothetical protein
VPNLNSHQFGKVGNFDLYMHSDFIEIIIRNLFVLSAISAVISKDKRGLLFLLFFSLLVIGSSMAFFSERFVVVTTPFYLMIVGRGFSFLDRKLFLTAQN